MAEVGSAFVSILPSAKGFGRQLNSQVGGEVDQAGKSVGRRFGTALKVGALAVAAGATVATGFLADSVQEASRLSEAQSKVGVVFGRSAGQIVAASRTSATAMGLSSAAYLDATGTFGNLLVSLDLGPKRAAAMSQQMVKLAGDLASFNNTSPEEALDALRSGLVGETEPLKRFGVNMNEATLKAQALKDGLITSTKQALTPQQKALAATALIMRQTATAQGDFARTSGGLANQQRILSAQFGNLKSSLGTALLPTVTSAVTSLNNLITGMRQGTGVGGQLVGIFNSLRGALVSVGGFVRENATALGFLVTVLGSALIAFKAFMFIRAVTAAVAAFNVVLYANPIGLVIGLIAGLVAGLVFAYKRSESFRNVVNAAFNAVRNVVGAVVRWFGSFVPTVFSKVVALVRGYVNVYRTVIVTAFNVARSVVSAATRAMSAAIKAVGSAVGGAIAFFNRFASAVGTNIRRALSFIASLPGKAKSALGNLGQTLYNAGAELVNGLIRGISSKIAAVGKKMEELAGKVKGFLPGSPVKEGPLTAWNNGAAGKRLVDMLAVGLSDTRSVDAAMNRLANRVQVRAPQISGEISGVGPRGAGARGGGTYQFYTFDLQGAVREAQRREAFAL